MAGPAIRVGTETGGIIHWPSCGKCGMVVDRYGIAEETSKYVEIYAEHHGQRDGVILLKGPFWGPNSLTREVRRLTFFAPVGEQVGRHMHVANPKKGST